MRFVEYIAQEESILRNLLNMNFIQQAKLDQKLHNNAIKNNSFGGYSGVLANDVNWKQKFIDIIEGKEKDPNLIKKTIDVIKQDITTHLNRNSSPKTGSIAWHKAWIQVYERWIKKLEEILGV